MANDTLDAGAIRRALGVRREVRVDGTVESTNDAAMAALRRGAPDGALFVAAAQRAGRGRHGRSWISPPGTGVYFSVAFRYGGEPWAVPRFAIGASLAVVRAVRLFGIEAVAEWPNDVLIGSRKVGGILCESRPCSPNREIGVVAGIGVNVTSPSVSSSTSFRREATGLREHATVPVSREAVVVESVLALDRIADALRSGAWGAVREGWYAIAPGSHGRKVVVTARRGGDVTRGVTRGLGDDGCLLVERSRGGIMEVRDVDAVREETA